MWELQLKRELREGRARFSLDLCWSSTAQRIVLHGPSGSGKTQALRIVAGIARPDQGRVALAGQVLLDTGRGIDLPPRRRRLPVVFQDYALFPHLTVRQNIAFCLGGAWPLLPGHRRHERDERVERWIQAFRLEAVASLKPHQISGGQRQRTALARALVTQPRAVLLDEPFAAVDAPLRRHLREELIALQQQLALPMLLISHDEEDLRHFAQDAVEIVDGRNADRRASLQERG